MAGRGLHLKHATIKISGLLLCKTQSQSGAEWSRLMSSDMSADSTEDLSWTMAESWKVLKRTAARGASRGEGTNQEGALDTPKPGYTRPEYGPIIAYRGTRRIPVSNTDPRYSLLWITT